MNARLSLLVLFIVLSCLSDAKRQRNRKYRDNDSTCQLEIRCPDETAQTALPVSLPIRGPRGPPGKDGATGAAGEDGMPGLPGLPGLSAQEPPKVAFFVGLSDNMGPVTEHTDIIFDRVLTNVGNAYSPSTGRFVARVNATFQFNIVVAAQGRQKAGVMLLKNGNMVATVWAESIPFWGSSSSVAILSLEPGDQVWLMLLNRASFLHGYMYTTFSGFLIFQN